MCLEAGFAENDFVKYATKKILRTRTQPRTFPQGPGPGPECQGPGQGQGEGQDLSSKDQDQDFKFVIGLLKDKDNNSD